MFVKEIDYLYKEQIIDILERLNMLRYDISVELIERESKDIKFLLELLGKADNCIKELEGYARK